MEGPLAGGGEATGRPRRGLAMIDCRDPMHAYSAIWTGAAFGAESAAEGNPGERSASAAQCGDPAAMAAFLGHFRLCGDPRR